MTAAVRKTRSSTGTRSPRSAISATANAVSVASASPSRAATAPADEREVDQRGRGHAAERRRDRQRGGAPRGEPAHRELALDLEPHDQEEHGEQAVVDPVAQRERERSPRRARSRTARSHSARTLRPSGEFDEGHGDAGSSAAAAARWRAPSARNRARRSAAGGRASRSSASASALSSHGALVAAAVDEEGRGDLRAAAPRALACRLRTRAPARAPSAALVRRAGARRARPRSPRGPRRPERRAALHQLVVRVPERRRWSRPRTRPSRPPRRAIVVAGDREVAEDVAHPLAEAVAQVGDDLVRRVAVRAA